jgi:hypothetical protein
MRATRTGPTMRYETLDPVSITVACVACGVMILRLDGPEIVRLASGVLPGVFDHEQVRERMDGSVERHRCATWKQRRRFRRLEREASV